MDTTDSLENQVAGAEGVDLDEFALWFTANNLSLMLRSDGGLWLCEAQGRHGDLPFSARSERCGTSKDALFECLARAQQHLAGDPYVIGK
jgi:hypothetical protein